MAANGDELQRLLQAYLETHGRGALEELVSGVRSVPQEEVSSQPAVRDRQRARRSRPPLRLSPSPVRRQERGRSGGSAAHPERLAVTRRRRTWAEEIGGIQAQDGVGSHGGGRTRRSCSPCASLPAQPEDASSRTPHDVHTPGSRRARPSQALRSSVVLAGSEQGTIRRMPRWAAGRRSRDHRASVGTAVNRVRLGHEAGRGSPLSTGSSCSLEE
ncbi:Hypothetical predicted protein, partial [Pelobates cultripes]